MEQILTEIISKGAFCEACAEVVNQIQSLYDNARENYDYTARLIEENPERTWLIDDQLKAKAKLEAYASIATRISKMI